MVALYARPSSVFLVACMVELLDKRWGGDGAANDTEVISNGMSVGLVECRTIGAADP